MKVEGHQHKRARLKRLHRDGRTRPNSKRKRRDRARDAMKLKVENYKAWLDSGIGQLQSLAKAAKETAKSMDGMSKAVKEKDGLVDSGCLMPSDSEEGEQ